MKAILESGLSYSAANDILKEEYDLMLSRQQSSNSRNGGGEHPPFVAVEERIKIIRSASCCPRGSITLLICPKCFTPHDKHYIICRGCLKKNERVRLIQRCQTKNCPANSESPTCDQFCGHADYSTNAIKVAFRPVMCHLIDLIAFGKGKYLRGVHRSEIILNLQYISENDLVNTESSLNSYAFFSSLKERDICECIRKAQSDTKPIGFRNFLEEETPLPLNIEGMLLVINE